jgi:endo-1,4-beta-xylanase
MDTKNRLVIPKEYNPKPVYNRLLKLIKEDWMTKNVKLTTDKTGKVSFHGFFGNYMVMITKPDGTKQTLDIHVSDMETNQWKFNL